ncbi:putative Exportin-T [Drepanopeziza brunnea f. sp. 'multigermtubi' MB_m1]|uniref:Exportin-T n=1 Tax=Marssonina brunnea f. sp. multigermtubi (strain MB_m1) TaxID=1072389 RepID=K1WNE6_MARBU|nr:putative Exportin-T [Drepanopeziza brunnea f. sp. 'multigermtubi' MB_m1]EKD19150.1 putative Exportin-T [Drepanopeziza brunnea f. sp. 'multigermtubi' MB_m1]
MDNQVENAIEIAWNPRSEQSLKAQAFDFLNQLRTDASGREACVALFTRTPKCSEVVRLVSLDVVNNAIQTQQLDTTSLNHIKETLLEYVRRTYATGDQAEVDPASLQNKLTQTLTFLFVSLYNQGWESFIDDILGLTSLRNNGTRDNFNGTVLYLRILGSIHDEIADVIISRSTVETKRNTQLKDAMRVRDVAKVAASWEEILNQWRDQNDGVVEMCLKVIGKWVSWIDISLIFQGVLPILFDLAGRIKPGNGEDKVRDAAIDTFTEIVAKKMKPADKIGLIVYLNLGQVISQLISSPALHDLRTTSSYDTDLAEAVAKLVNNTVFDIVKVLEDTQAPIDTREQAEQLIHSFLPLLLRFFADEYDEICSTVIPSLTDLLTFLRKAKPLPTKFAEMLPPVLNAIIQKMRYDETSSWGAEDEQTDEAEFQELRKRLQVLQKSVAAVDEALYVDILSNVIGNTFQNLDQQGGQMDWRDLDLALHEMYLFGELTIPNGGLYAKSQPSSVAAERLIIMMSKMVESGIANFAHPAIQLQYMEIVVRYCSFFENQSRYIQPVLEQFVVLVHYPHIRVRTRSWYLFQRFVKHLRAHVGNVAETVIQSIGDLLPIKAEVPNETADDDMSSDESDHSADAAFNGQLYLFEAIGCISSTTTTPVEKQILYARSIMEPLFSDIERNLGPAKSGDAQAVQQIHHVIMALGTLAHGFSDWTPGNPSTASHAPKPEVSAEFSRAAEAILIALEALKSSFDVRTAARASFTRLMGVLGIGILPSLPRWIDGLLSQSSSKDEMAMFLRLLDQVVFGFKKEIYDVLDSLLTPLLQRVFAGLAEPITGTDDEVQLAELRREYLTFVQIILNNDLASVLVSASNQGFFESLIASVTTLAQTVTSGTGNLAASRLAFSVITRMADLWGGANIATIGPQPASSSTAPSPAFDGFDRFLIERFHPICWVVLREQTFRPATDAQAKQVLNEIAGLEQMIYLKTGDMFIQHLQQEFFPAMGVNGSDFIKSMTTSTDRKGLAGYLQGFLKDSRA